jgi:hypothetical protein
MLAVPDSRQGVACLIGRDCLTEEWRKLLIEELHNLFYLSDIVRGMKPRRMRWVGHVACMGRLKYTQNFSWKVRNEEVMV